MTEYVDPDPLAAIDLMLHRIDAGPTRPKLYSDAREGGLVELLLIVGAERYGSHEELRKGLQFFAHAVEIGDVTDVEGETPGRTEVPDTSTTSTTEPERNRP
jgi:hypothetical protein